MSQNVARAVTGFAIICVFFVLLVPVLVLEWGRRLEYTPEYVEHRVAVGMTLEQAAYELGPIQDLPKEKLSGGGYRILLTEPGLGSWFAPQYEVSLEFGKTGRLQRGFAKVVYQLSD